MKRLCLHPHLDTLFALWAEPREAARAMSQTISDDFLDHIFIAEAASDAPPIRIVKVGEKLAQSHVEGLRNRDLLTLFSGHDRVLIWGLLNTIKVKKQPGLARLKAQTNQELVLNVDLALAPLGGSGQSTRWLGFYQPNGAIEGLIQSQEISSVHLPKAAERAKA